MAKQTVTTKKTTVSIKPKSGGTGKKRCPTCGKYMGGGGK